MVFVAQLTMAMNTVFVCLFVPVGSLCLSGPNADNMVPNNIVQPHVAEAHVADRAVDFAEAPVADRAKFFSRVDLATLQHGVGKNISDDMLWQKITEIEPVSGAGGMMPDEYFAFMSYVRDRAPQNLLVWGIGYASTLIKALNEGGYTLFLEFNAEWVAKTPAATLNYISYNDKAFHTQVDHYDDFVLSPHRANIAALNSGVCWDTVLVDSPYGQRQTDTGRAVPLYTAKVDVESCIAMDSYEHDKEVAVWAHDCNRALEDAVTHVFYGEPGKVIGVKRLSKWTLLKPKWTFQMDVVMDMAAKAARSLMAWLPTR
jgi:hypothetical protein